MFNLFTWFTERVIEVSRLTSAVVRGASKPVTVVGVKAVTSLATLPAVTVGGTALSWKITTSTLWTEVQVLHLSFIKVFFQKRDKHSHAKTYTPFRLAAKHLEKFTGMKIKITYKRGYQCHHANIKPQKQERYNRIVEPAFWYRNGRLEIGQESVQFTM